MNHIVVHHFVQWQIDNLAPWFCRPTVLGQWRHEWLLVCWTGRFLACLEWPRPFDLERAPGLVIWFWHFCLQNIPIFVHYSILFSPFGLFGLLYWVVWPLGWNCRDLAWSLVPTSQDWYDLWLQRCASHRFSNIIINIFLDQEIMLVISGLPWIAVLTIGWVGLQILHWCFPWGWNF